jgi:hypothetical protein
MTATIATIATFATMTLIPLACYRISTQNKERNQQN